MFNQSVISRATVGALETLQAFASDPECVRATERFAELACGTAKRRGLLMACGNGGSMCGAMHLAQEWSGRFRSTRPALRALAFSDPAQLTCIANDFGFDQVFARALEAVGSSGDLLVTLSTSGNSPNILRAVEVARAMDVRTVALLGRGGGTVGRLVDVPIIVPHATTADRIQEVHTLVLHSVTEAVERDLFPESYESNRAP